MHILAAGSLRGALTQVMADYQAAHGGQITCDFGPAGILRRRIEGGAPCDLFLSADKSHPQALQEQGRATAIRPFIANRIGITTTTELAAQYPDALTLLAQPRLIIGTSTPGDDPGGDYAQLLYQRIARVNPSLAADMLPRTRRLVGGTDSAPVPAGRMAAEWLITTGQADMFIGYQHYQRQLAQFPHLASLVFPADCRTDAVYYLACLHDNAQSFADYLQQPAATARFIACGFLPLPDSDDAHCYSPPLP